MDFFSSFFAPIPGKCVARSSVWSCLMYLSYSVVPTQLFLLPQTFEVGFMIHEFDVEFNWTNDMYVCMLLCIYMYAENTYKVDASFIHSLYSSIICPRFRHYLLILMNFIYFYVFHFSSLCQWNLCIHIDSDVFIESSWGFCVGLAACDKSPLPYEKIVAVAQGEQWGVSTQWLIVHGTNVDSCRFLPTFVWGICLCLFGFSIKMFCYIQKKE